MSTKLKSNGRNRKEAIELELAGMKEISGISNLELSNRDTIAKKYAYLLVDKYIVTSCNVISDLQSEENELYLSVQDNLSTTNNKSEHSTAAPNEVNCTCSGILNFARVHKLTLSYILGIILPCIICITISRHSILFKDHPLSRNDFNVIAYDL